MNVVRCCYRLRHHLIFNGTRMFDAAPLGGQAVGAHLSKAFLLANDTTITRKSSREFSPYVEPNRTWPG